MRTYLLSLIVVIIVAFCAACGPSSKAPDQPSTSTAKDTTVDDLGLSDLEKQLEVYEDAKRVIWQKPEMVISLIGDIERKTIVDIGAGTGYFAFRLAGRAKKVIAVEIDEQLVGFMDSIKHIQLTGSRVNRFETRLGTPDNPNLKIAEADAVLLTNTYTYIDDRITYFSNLHKNLTAKGRIVIVDYKPINLPVGPDMRQKMSTFDITQELQEAGYNIVQVDETSLQYQYIIIAESKY